jgi:hypothetical protein
MALVIKKETECLPPEFQHTHILPVSKIPNRNIIRETPV